MGRGCSEVRSSERSRRGENIGGRGGKRGDIIKMKRNIEKWRGWRVQGDLSSVQIEMDVESCGGGRLHCPPGQLA